MATPWGGGAGGGIRFGYLLYPPLPIALLWANILCPRWGRSIQRTTGLPMSAPWVLGGMSSRQSLATRDLTRAQDFEPLRRRGTPPGSKHRQRQRSDINSPWRRRGGFAVGGIYFRIFATPANTHSDAMGYSVTQVTNWPLIPQKCPDKVR